MKDYQWPIPRHEFGYPDSQINEVFLDHDAEELLPEFWAFMDGQTTMKDETTGEFIVYQCDFINFFQRTFWD